MPTHLEGRRRLAESFISRADKKLMMRGDT